MSMTIKLPDELMNQLSEFDSHVADIMEDALKPERRYLANRQKQTSTPCCLGNQVGNCVVCSAYRLLSLMMMAGI